MDQKEFDERRFFALGEYTRLKNDFLELLEYVPSSQDHFKVYSRDILPRLKLVGFHTFSAGCRGAFATLWAFRMEATPLSGAEVPASTTTFDRHRLCSRTYMVTGTLSLLSRLLFQLVSHWRGFLLQALAFGLPNRSLRCSKQMNYIFDGDTNSSHR